MIESVPENDPVRHRSSPVETDDNTNKIKRLSLISEGGNSSIYTTTVSTIDLVQPAPSDSKELQLKRKVGLFSGVTFIMGTMIGSGIFISSRNLLRRAQSPGLCLTMWGVCGVYALLGAISFCEIGTLIPRSGGEFTYFLEAFGPTHEFFGPILAFEYVWMTALLRKPMSLAVLSLAFARYSTSPILAVLDFRPDPYLDYILSRLIACLCTSLVTFINCYSVTAATRVQIIFTVSNLAAIGIIVGGGFYNLSLGHTENLETGFEGSATSFGQIAQGFYGGIFAYSGWNSLNYITEELKNPYRNLPLAIIIAIPSTAICYLLVNLSYLTALSPEEIISSDAVAVSWANKVMGSASFLIPLGVVMSVFGSANSSMFTAGRISHVAGREGHLPDFLSYIHIERRTPIAPILLNGFISILMIIPGNIGTLIDLFGFTTLIFDFASMVALIVMRFTKKDDQRPIKVPIIIPIIVMLFSAYLVIAPIILIPQMEYFYVLLFIFLGFIFYVPFIYYKKTLPGMDRITILLQKTLLIAPTTPN